MDEDRRLGQREKRKRRVDKIDESTRPMSWMGSNEQINRGFPISPVARRAESCRSESEKRGIKSTLKSVVVMLVQFPSVVALAKKVL